MTVNSRYKYGAVDHCRRTYLSISLLSREGKDVALDKIVALRQSALLRSLENRQLQALAGIAKERSFDQGASLISAGTSGALAMFVVLDGELEVRRGRTVLAKLGPGDHFGEMAVLSSEGTPRSADVVALSPTRVLQIAKWDLMPFLKSNPDVAIALIEELARRLADADARLAAQEG